MTISAPKHMSRWKQFRPGLIVAGGFLAVSFTSCLLYLLDRHEYSIPMFIVVCLSFPVYLVLFQILKPQTAFIERLPGGEIIGLALLLMITAGMYFLIGQCAGALWRKWKVGNLPDAGAAGRMRKQQTKT